MPEDTTTPADDGAPTTEPPAPVDPGSGTTGGTTTAQPHGRGGSPWGTKRDGV